jgi:hypothetical protein
VEELSGRRWQYSSGTDLALVNAWLVEEGEPLVNWVSRISGHSWSSLDDAARAHPAKQPGAVAPGCFSTEEFPV